MTDKSTSKLIQELQIIFNSYIRLRDKGKGCISCGDIWPSDAGHLWKISLRPEMRFNEHAVHAQCRCCNSMPDANFDAYCEGIINRYGSAYLYDLIEEMNRLHRAMPKWSRSDLIEMIAYYKKEIKKLKS